MRKILLLTLWAFSIQNTFATTKDDFSYKHHTFEVSLTPALDHYFLTNTEYPTSTYLPPNNSKQNIKNFYRPFIGANLGLSYLYRPIKFAGISTEINFTEYVSKLGKITGLQDQSFAGLTDLYFKGYSQTGYISVPVYLHAFYTIKKLTLELATGPEFLFPVFNAAMYTQTSTSEPRMQYVYNETDRNNPQLMRQYSQFGWDVQLNVNIPVKKNFYMGVGPEMKFLSIRPFNPDPYYINNLHQTNYYTGIKVSFRFPTDFRPKAHRNESSSPTDK